MLAVEAARLIKEDQRTYEARSKGKLTQSSARYTLIDLFSGAGGMTLGFPRSSVNPLNLSGPTTSINSVLKHITGILVHIVFPETLLISSGKEK